MAVGCGSTRAAWLCRWRPDARSSPDVLEWGRSTRRVVGAGRVTALRSPLLRHVMSLRTVAAQCSLPIWRTKPPTTSTNGSATAPWKTASRSSSARRARGRLAPTVQTSNRPDHGSHGKACLSLAPWLAAWLLAPSDSAPRVRQSALTLKAEDGGRPLATRNA